MKAKPSILSGSTGYHGIATGIRRFQVISSNRRSILKMVRSETTSKPKRKDSS